MHPHPNYIQLYPHYLYQMTSNINSTHQATKCLNDLNIYQCPVEIDALSDVSHNSRHQHFMNFDVILPMADQKEDSDYSAYRR